MADAGIEYVRMGEFAWSRIEPEPGAFDVEWLDEVLDLVGGHGMRAVLSTPTAHRLEATRVPRTPRRSSRRSRTSTVRSRPPTSPSSSTTRACGRSKSNRCTPTSTTGSTR
nr:beta-galactosidase [Natronorubrum texcoconense]